MNTIKEYYLEKCSTPSDINEHLPILLDYAERCESIVEMGTRQGISIYALALAKPKKLISVDIVPFQNSKKLKELCDEQRTDYEHIIGSTLDIDIPEVDFIFIDTEHSYLQLKSELSKHGNRAKKYLAFHDTVTFGNVDSNEYGDQGLKYENNQEIKHGLLPAINEFIQSNPHWSIDLVKTNNNGFMVLKRI